ncbi:NAD(P)-dependent oxidoreductase [Dactylosporangium sp. NPDC051541]|uniref:NAD(P)-dependent oxidoreductase n=1 Tax=Dactylosporangium sp. NPDC051541 TaxID=3363977 RepID=UPI0037AA88B5
MRLAMFGATGRAGRVVLERALQDGHEVHALTRDATQIEPRPRLHVVEGDVRDSAAVARTIDGADAIVSTLARPRRGPDICTEGIRSILTVAPADARLVVLSNYGVAASRHRTAYVAVSWLLERAVLQDKEQMEALIRAGGTAWTVVRAPILTNGPETGRLRAGTDLRLSFTAKVSRADLAGFILTELRANRYRSRSVTVTTEPGRRPEPQPEPPRSTVDALPQTASFRKIRSRRPR